MTWSSAIGPLCSFAWVRNSIFASARAQARRRALGCRGSACARPRCARVPCDARSCGPLHNFLRSLRSLWSNRCNESEHEARCARGHKPCASRRRNSPRQPSARRLAGGIALRVERRATSPRSAGPRGDACRGELRTRRLNPGRYPPSGRAHKQAFVFGSGPKGAALLWGKRPGLVMSPDSRRSDTLALLACRSRRPP